MWCWKQRRPFIRVAGELFAEYSLVSISNIETSFSNVFTKSVLLSTCEKLKVMAISIIFLGKDARFDGNALQIAKRTMAAKRRPKLSKGVASNALSGSRSAFKRKAQKQISSLSDDCHSQLLRFRYWKLNDQVTWFGQ